MKKLINYWPALTGFAFTFLIAVLATSWTPAKAQSQERKGANNEVVTLWADLQNDATGTSSYAYNGANIFCSSSSDGAPKFPQYSQPSSGPLTNLASGLKILLDDGFRITYVGDFGRSFVLVKP